MACSRVERVALRPALLPRRRHPPGQQQGRLRLVGDDWGAQSSSGQQQPLRDRSAKQRQIPKQSPSTRPFVSRCFEVQLPCETKMVYIALAHRCEVWTKGAEGAVKRLGRTRIAADAGLGLTRTKQALATLVSNGLVTIRRTGRTNIYTVRIPAAALELVNTTPRRATLESEPWKADGVSRRTWYRDRARTDPKTTHGGKRHEQSVSGEIPVSSGTNRTLSSSTDGQTGSPSDGQTGSPSTVGGSVGSTRTSATRWTCPDCGNDWPKSYGPECHPCRDRARETAKPRATAQPTHDEPKRCTCGDAYRNSYNSKCIDCEGKPSGAQRDAVRATQADAPPPLAETETSPPPETETPPPPENEVPPDGGEPGPAELRFKADFAKWTVGKRPTATHRSDRRRLARTARHELADLAKGEQDDGHTESRD